MALAHCLCAYTCKIKSKIHAETLCSAPIKRIKSKVIDAHMTHTVMGTHATNSLEVLPHEANSGLLRRHGLRKERQHDLEDVAHVWRGEYVHLVSFSL